MKSYSNKFTLTSNNQPHLQIVYFDFEAKTSSLKSKFLLDFENAEDSFNQTFMFFWNVICCFGPSEHSRI